MERYAIYEGHMEDLMKKVTRIKNKCEKFGCEFHFEEVGEEYREVVSGHHYNEETGKYEDDIAICRFVIVEAEGTALINNWEFVASVEHTEKGNIFSKALTDIEIPIRYRHGDRYCEHCNTRRARKNVFIIHNTETDEFKQVGNSCLNDFTHGMSVAWASEMASVREIFKEAEEFDASYEFSRGGRWHEYIPTEEMLCYAAETVRHFGYSKSMSSRSTKERCIDYFNCDHNRFSPFTPKEVIMQIVNEMRSVGFNAKSEEATQMAHEALEWIEAQEASNDYMHNLKVVTSLDYVDWSNMGILVSLLPTYNRELERQAERALREEERLKELELGKNSMWVGEVGKKMTADIVNFKCITSWSNCYDGYHSQTTYMYKFVTADGNILIWKTQKDIDCVASISGTVKEHSEYNGVKQTVLTRCKVA